MHLTFKIRKKPRNFANMENHTLIICDLKNLTNFANNMESHKQFTSDMKNLTKFAYNLENHTQLTCDKKSPTNVAYNRVNHTQFTCNLKNLTHFAINMESHTWSTSDMNTLSTFSYNMESHTQFTSDMKNLTNFANNLEKQAQLTCDMENLPIVAYNMENHTQFTCDRKNRTHVACNMESHTRSTGDMNNLSTFSHNMESHTQFTSDKENLTNFAYNVEIIHNFPWNVIFSRNFAPHLAEFFLRLEKSHCEPMSASCIKQHLGNWLVISDVLISPKSVVSDRIFPLTDINWKENWNKVHPWLVENGWHAMIMPWSCHDEGMTVMFFGMVVMIHALITVWLPCFLYFFKKWRFCLYFFFKWLLPYFIYDWPWLSTRDVTFETVENYFSFK